MKSEELRIGNFVFYPSDTNLLSKVTCLGNTSIEVENIDYEQELSPYHQNCEDIIQPIPLTEEWLLKFGFEETWNDGKFRKEYTIRKPHFYLFHYKNGKNESCKWEGLDMDTSAIKYVHQLQNLHFALTGTELTIKQTEDVKI